MHYHSPMLHTAGISVHSELTVRPQGVKRGPCGINPLEKEALRHPSCLPDSILG